MSLLSPMAAVLAQVQPADIPAGVKDRIDALGHQFDALRQHLNDLDALVGLSPDTSVTRLQIFHGYVPVFIISFLVALAASLPISDGRGWIGTAYRTDSVFTGSWNIDARAICAIVAP